MALEDMIEVARESEHPRAFEVLSGMIKNISDVNDRLMDLNKKNKELLKKDDAALPPQNQQNNFFLTTSDLQKMMAQGDIVDVTPEPEQKLPRESER